MPKIPIMSVFGKLLAALCLSHAALGAEAPLGVTQAHYRTVAGEQLFDALIEPARQSIVAAQTSSRVHEITVDVDDRVSRNQVLVRLLNTELQARLTGEQAGLSEAQVRHKEAQRDFARIKSIYEKRLIARVEMDRATAVLDAAQARLEAAQARVVEGRESADHAVIKAPYDGIIVQRHAEVGEMVQPGQPLLTLRALDKLRVLIDVPQTFIKTVRAQGRVHILVPGQSSPLEAAPLTIFPQADAVTHTVKVRADLPAGHAGVYPGMLVKASFAQVTGQRLQIPYSAVVHRSEVTGVYVVGKEGRVTLRQIRVGQNYDDGMIEVLAGLDVGERVALDPVRATATLKQQRTRKE